MHVHVELPEELDVEEYRLRNARGEIPDHTPYGLHHLGDEGDVVTFRRPARGVTDWAARKVRNQLDGYEAVTALSSARQRRGADAIFCMDERTGLPAAYTTHRPVVTGVAWLERPELLARTHRRSAEGGLSRAAGIFTQSPAMVPILREHWDVDPERVHGVRLGIDPEFYPEQPWEGRDPNGMTVTSVGDDRGRDHATLVAAVRRVRDQGLPAWLELATTLHVDLPPDAGVLHARRMNAAMRGLYERSSVVAIALRPNPQGSGLTVALEALASGRPVVATDNPGMDEYVDHGRTGLLVPPGDPEAMASAIGDLLADPERAAEMGRAGRKEVEARFTSAHMAADLRDILRGVVA
ncbi:glycosyltransferase family 4 protein [Actinomycetospora endophytica]|uniref:Glycosyltransferase family 4 protein n=1 Tax=Actinomycetospora endophytica TaxID=2291215 RepID=A0ABS8P2C4_9PSEU|nr:glycosyltransferase family 4 protein [Actinomycetospora endophytica]MCD2192378.1 glycosyltransferase family 4 protein [Actinomycetospora endophytica]